MGYPSMCHVLRGNVSHTFRAKVASGHRNPGCVNFTWRGQHTNTHNLKLSEDKEQWDVNNAVTNMAYISTQQHVRNNPSPPQTLSRYPHDPRCSPLQSHGWNSWTHQDPPLHGIAGQRLQQTAKTKRHKCMNKTVYNKCVDIASHVHSSRFVDRRKPVVGLPHQEP
jgi:hypothetical protein